MATRTIETLGKDRETVNVWNVPEHVSLDTAIKKQDDAKFRTLYFVFSHPKGRR